MSQQGQFIRSSGGGVLIETITGNSGGPVGPDGSNNINFVGSNANNINIVGNPGTNTLTASVSGTTNHSLLLGNASGSINSLGVAANGQLPIGSGGANPVLATLTAGTGISIANGAGSITISTSGGIATTYDEDSGSATPALGILNVNGGNNITTTGSGNSISIAVTGTINHAVQVGNASGSLTSIAVGATNTALLGSTGANPSFGQVPNAALVNDSITLSNGNNITVTGSPVVLGGTASFNLTGTTAHSLQIGNAGGSLTSLGVATNGQLPIGSAGADPVLATLTPGTGISISNGAGSITISATGTSTFNYTAVSTTPYVVASTDDFLGVTTSALAITIELPNAPSTGRVYYIKDVSGDANVNNITVTTVGGAVDIDAGTTYTMNTQYASIGVLFNGSAYLIF